MLKVEKVTLLNNFLWTELNDKYNRGKYNLFNCK